VSSDRPEEVLAHEEPALVRAAAFLGPDRPLVESDVGRDWIGVYEVARCPGREWTARPVVVADVDLAVYGHHSADAVLVVANAGGRSEAWLADGRTFAPGARLDLPADAVIAGGALPDPLVRGSGSGLEVIMSLSAPDLPAEVFRWRETSGLERLTYSASRLSGLRLVHPEESTARAADGLEIPLFVYRPPGRADGRVVVYVHGGPESQSTTAFQPIVQALLMAGIGVVVPNVRGSTGYGRRYAAADDGRRRLDAVGDLAAVHDRLAPLGFDPTRAVLWGGSYGGYMVLAGLAFQPERWAAGVDIVGISDLVTFLENTSAYRRAQREREYGSLATDRDFLAAASPLRRVEAIRAPLFVLHGANDPRVPLSEAEQLVGALRQRGVPVELRVYPDEGHGLTKRANRLDAYPRVFDWLDRVVPPR
jgi:dipeptidyl aminopeptidase/acylaminoacyl peptidase